MKSFSKIFLIIISFTITITSCNEDNLIEQPPHLITAETLLKNRDGFELAVNGLYSLTKQWRSAATGNDRTRALLSMHGTDAWGVSHATSVDFSSIANFWAEVSHSQQREYIDNFAWLYMIVNTANTIINRIDNHDIDWGGDSNIKNYYSAEAKASRAWAYRHLTYLWGDVPLSLEESSGTTIKTDWTRTPVDEVRRQIIEDFEFAEQYIPIEPFVQGRMTKGVVQHYLAEMYLVLNDPVSSLLWASKPIDNPAYYLITQRYGVKANKPGVPFMDMFESGNANREEGNKEALWVFQYDRFSPGGGAANMRRPFQSRFRDIRIGNIRPLQSSYARGGRGFGRLAMTQYAWNVYEARDDRRSNHAIRQFFILKTAEENIAPFLDDILPPGYSFGDTIWCADLSIEELTRQNRERADWPYPRKHDDMEPDVPDAHTYHWKDQPYVRLAETYLLKAEAQFLSGDTEGAAQTINIIRRRSNASDITAADIDMDFILDERTRELLAEEERRYTLLRTNTLLERNLKYNKVSGHLMTPRDKLYPIPQNVLDANLSIEMPQNPEYN